MYSTCIFCQTSLGTNEAVEHFPVGRRLAFDAARGRLWAVCKTCERWNLSPIDDRWEAIEECEKLFRDSTLRVSTDNIGLAKLKEGTTLIRIGDPQRPEMAAWRYGDQFHRRRLKYLAMFTGVSLLSGGVYLAGPILGVIGGGTVMTISYSAQLLLYARTALRIPIDGSVLKLTEPMARKAVLRTDRDEGLVLEFTHQRTGGAMSLMRNAPRITLTGDNVRKAARLILPRINYRGGGAKDVSEAVRVIEGAGGSEQFFDHLATKSPALPWGNDLGLSAWNANAFHEKGIVAKLPMPIRMALEMSLHEEDERRALEGELSLLEDRWREAEEVAAIADDMFFPSSLIAKLKHLKGESE